MTHEIKLADVGDEQSLRMFVRRLKRHPAYRAWKMPFDLVKDSLTGSWRLATQRVRHLPTTVIVGAQKADHFRGQGPRVADGPVKIPHQFRVQVLQRATEGEDRLEGVAFMYMDCEGRDAVLRKFAFDVLQRARTNGLARPAEQNSVRDFFAEGPLLLLD